MCVDSVQEMYARRYVNRVSSWMDEATGPFQIVNVGTLAKSESVLVGRRATHETAFRRLRPRTACGAQFDAAHAHPSRFQANDSILTSRPGLIGTSAR